MQLFAAPGKDMLAAAALDASMRAVKLCGAGARDFQLEEHQHWAAEAVQGHAAVTVGAPETRGSYLNKHTAFLILQQPSQQGVRRRFRDFEWLRIVLHARYTGLLLPSLPDKTAPVLKSDAFLQSRMRGLQHFLNGVLQSPYLCSDAAVHSFLTETGDEAVWEETKKRMTVLDNAGPGQVRWLQRILGEHIASSPESEIATFKLHVEQHERLLGSLVACSKRIADRSAAMAKDVGALNALVAGWQSAEKGKASSSKDASLVELLDNSARAMGNWTQVMHFQPAVYELLLLENIQYMLHQATDMKELLVERDQALNMTATTQTSSPPESSVSSTSFPSAGGFSRASLVSAASSASQLASRLMSAAEPSAVDLETQKRRAQHVSELTTRALMAEEMERFRSEKTQTLENLMQHLACAEAQIAKRSSSVWREYLKTTSTDVQALATSTKQILDSAPANINSSTSSGEADAEAY